MQDWNFTSGNDMCALRASGILLREGKILLQQDLQSLEFALPGGHVQIGETTEQALVREFFEEMAVKISVKKLVGVGEIFWHWQNHRTNCIDFSYLIELENPAQLDFTVPQALLDNPNVQLSWQPLNQLDSIDLQPSALTEILRKPLDQIWHFVSADSEGGSEN